MYSYYFLIIDLTNTMLVPSFNILEPSGKLERLSVGGDIITTTILRMIYVSNKGNLFTSSN